LFPHVVVELVQLLFDKAEMMGEGVGAREEVPAKRGVGVSAIWPSLNHGHCKQRRALSRPSGLAVL
jgi:hypothetical protein